MRITGGTFRSRALRAPRGNTTRPTSDRVREALFGILTSAGALEGARVLDLYSGTGALALEALSRGAAEATLVESSRAALQALRANVRSLAIESRVRVVQSDVEHAIGRLEGSFDLVFADPPWVLVDEGEASRMLELLVARSVLVDQSVIVLEHASRSSPPVVRGLDARETRKYGDTALTFYEKPPDEPH
jgi:16S rRNA (guanine966-N2)-methyltransferase